MTNIAFKFLASLIAMLLLYCSDDAISDEDISVTPTVNAVKNSYYLDLEKIVQMTSSTINNTMKHYSLPLYRAYFEVVSENVILYELHENYQKVFKKSGQSVNLIRIGYSPYLARAVNKVAMTDCNIIYFPNKFLVEKIITGKKITKKQMYLLLHEIGHTQQCQRSSKEEYARRWFNELNPAIVTVLKSGQVETKTIHDAMPLEKEADVFAKKMLIEIVKY